jgi:simple sugar transport system ATP-binding protein
MTLELELRGITKRFPGVLANDHIDLDVRKGEIHALMGENGAGKSTLMSILYGLLHPDEGEIWVRGARQHFSSPNDAIAAGLGMVFQSFKLFPSLTVAENVVYGREPTHGRRLARRAAERHVAELSQRYGLAVDPAARVEDLPVGVLQRVEIVKALYREASVLILDEPTAVLTPQESEALFEVLRALARDGRTIIFITHKLKEVMAMSDRVTVLRDGRAVARFVTAETSPAEITRAMTGRDVTLRVTPPTRPPGEPVLRCRGLRIEGEHGRAAVDDATFEVRAGEIVGIAGVAGNGQAELIEAITGLRSAAAGTIQIAGRDVTRHSVADRRAGGLSYIPEDRHAVGTAGAADTATNLALGHHRRPPLLRRGLLQPQAVKEHARTLIDRFQIKVSGPETLVGTLSGGNLQKVVVAREMSHEAPLLIAEQPTRGVDVGAIEFIHAEVTACRDRGGAVLLVSAELSEILSLSGRILVMFEGRIVAELESGEAEEATLGLLMAGATPEVVDGHGR